MERTIQTSSAPTTGAQAPAVVLRRRDPFVFLAILLAAALVIAFAFPATVPVVEPAPEAVVPADTAVHYVSMQGALVTATQAQLFSGAIEPAVHTVLVHDIPVSVAHAQLFSGYDFVEEPYVLVQGVPVSVSHAKLFSGADELPIYFVNVQGQEITAHQAMLFSGAAEPAA